MSQDKNSIYTGIAELTMTNTKSVVANSQIEALSTNLKETRVSHFFFVITPGDANDISFVIGRIKLSPHSNYAITSNSKRQLIFAVSTINTKADRY